MELEVGKVVFFGRPEGEKTKGEIIKVNQRTVKIKQLEARGTLQAGAVWNVDKSMVYEVRSGVPVLPTALPELSVGDKCEFDHGGDVIKGLVIRVNRSSYSVLPPNEPRSWTVPFPLARKIVAAAA